MDEVDVESVGPTVGQRRSSLRHVQRPFPPSQSAKTALAVWLRRNALAVAIDLSDRSDGERTRRQCVLQGSIASSYTMKQQSIPLPWEALGCKENCSGSLTL